MNGVTGKPVYRTRQDMETLRIIRRCGFVYRELNGVPWVTTGEPISVKRFDRLLALGLIEPQGDSLFGAPSQTYIPTRTQNVQDSSTPSYSDAPS